MRMLRTRRSHPDNATWPRGKRSRARAFVLFTLLAGWVGVMPSTATNAAARGATSYGRLTVVSVLALCKRSPGSIYRVELRAYFRPGPLSHGPAMVHGGLFDSNKVPTNAGRHVAAHHGVLFGIAVSSPLPHKARLATEVAKRHALIVARGRLLCGYPPSLPDMEPVSLVVRTKGRT
jgi:hypothetical protein